MKIRWVILLALLAFVVTTVVRFPADVVFANINTTPLIISNPGGTIWRGTARSAGVINGPAKAESVNWILNPLTLISGKLGANIDFKLLDGTGEADVARAFNGDVFVSDADITINAQSLVSLMPAALVQLGGELQLHLDDAHFNPQHPESIRGQLHWSNAQIRDPVTASLGNVTLDITPNAAGHSAELKNQGGMVTINGKVDIDKQGGYRADIRLQPVSNAPPDIDSTLSLLGRKGSDGSYRLRQNGRLRDLL